MPKTLESPAEFQARQRAYLDRVTALTAELAEFFRSRGFKVEEGTRLVDEPPEQAIELPTLVVHVDGDEVHTKPVPPDPWIGKGRVELQGWPTLRRVYFLAQSDGWTIMTNSGVPLRMPWTADSFVQLARDLVAYP